MKYKHLAILMGVMITATSVGSTATAFAADSKTESTQDADDTIEDTAEASDEKADDSKEETCGRWKNYHRSRNQKRNEPAW